ncbi:MAG: GNAT family N-acetyltransferase [Bacteroidetes bacterium]|nr:GNAT family N-acetyltransferase [Bacteroidota bacterium]MBS1540937.1 GNAT family N-acetyltransferase [Bacteroidota bacterium]
MAEIKTAKSDDEIVSCWEAMHLLRPSLKKENFVQQIKLMQGEGYHLIYLIANGQAVSVAGYRIFSMLCCGKQLYIDDLSTLENCRGKGYASTLLNRIYDIAKKENCISVYLDSGPTRTIAHKLYFNEGFTIRSFHFHKEL